MIGRRQFLACAASAAPILLAACSRSGRSNQASSTSASVPPTRPPTVLEQTTTLPTTTALSDPSTTGPAEPTSTSAVVATAPTSVEIAPTTTTPGGPAVFIDHGDPGLDMVALTFHLSGAPATVAALLDLLHERSVTVTAFAVGTWITAHPDITKRLVADGHELANHTEHHLEMSTLTPEQINAEIVECGQAITPFIGSIGRWFRPSATVIPAQVILDEAGKAGYRVSVGYDIDSVDNKDPGAAAIVANVEPHLHGGAIVSLHFGHPGTIEALPQILDALAARGLRPVTVGVLLA
ncbi:MAG: polysaccharide deacetylase [Acidimicrobiales bacterium]|nr:polysaccharide deacetylase [Acidimicrobiales bacterium]